MLLFIKTNSINSLQMNLFSGQTDLWAGIVVLILINIVLFVFLIRKVKKRKRLESENQQYNNQLQDLKQKSSKQENLIKSIPEILFVLSNENKILEVKTHDESLLPLPEFKMIQSNINEVFPPEQAKILAHNIDKTLSEKTIQTFQFTPSKSQKNFEAQLIPFQQNQVLCLLWDISRENEVLEKLENSLQQLEETHTSRDKFFSIIAHDLKNPFNALIGFSSLLNEEFENLSDEENKEYIKQIYQSSDSLFNLLRNLLSWTKSKTGELEYHPEKLDINSFINENLKILWPEAQQKNINIQTNAEQENSKYVLADRNMLNSIIRNLTANAIKFSNSDSIISVNTTQKDEFIECAVTDNGIGISREDRENIFRIENKSQKQGTENEEGTGLGLLLCKEFVEKHKGQIWVESEPEQGSTFYFTLPLAK